MKDERKTREQLLHELSALRQRNTELEEAETERGQSEGLTERKQMELALRTERLLGDSIIENVPAGIAFLDNDFVLRRCNRAYANLIETYTPYTPQQALGMSYFDYVPGSREQVEEWFRAVRDSGQAQTHQSFELTIMRDGQEQTTWWDTSVVPVPGPTDAVDGILILTQDVTGHQEAEQALTTERNLLRTLIDNLPDPTYFKDTDSCFVAGNMAVAQIMGAETPDQLLGKTDFDFYPQELAERFYADERQVIQSGQPLISQEEPVTDPTGRVRWFSTTKVPLRDEQGNVVGVVGIGRDITERKRAEEALRESEGRYRSFVRNFQGIAYRGNLDFTPVFFHGAVEAITGYTEDEFVSGKPRWDQVIHEEDLPGIFKEAEKLRSIPRHSSGREYRIRRKDGQIRWVHEMIQNICDDSGQVVMVQGEMYDITDRKRAQEELQSSLSRTQLLNRVIATTASTLDFRTVLKAVCQELAGALDIPQAAFALLDADEKQLTVVAEYPAQGRPSALGAVIPVAGNQATQYVLEHRTPLVIGDAQTDPRQAVIHDLERQRGTVSLLIVPLMIRDQVIGTLGLDATELREFTPEEIDLVQNVAAAAGQALENAQLHEAVQKELAERKQAEERLRASLREKEVLLTEIHHRVKNNLQVVSSLLDLQADTVQDTDAYQAFHETRARVKSMALIHERLYQSSDLAHIDAGQYVQEMLDYLLGAYAAGAGDITASVHADEVALGVDTAIPCGLIITELVSNALRHAFPAEETAGQGEIRVELRRLDGQLCLMVSDNGVGLPPDLDFYGTESLGLQLVNILIDQLDGTVEVEGGTSPAGKRAGTTVKITFPQQP